MIVMGSWARIGAIIGVVGLAGCDGAASSGGDGSLLPDAVDADLSPDALMVGPWTTAVDCTTAADAIYATAGLVAGPRGSVAACADGGTLDQAAVTAAMVASGAEGVVAVTGVRVVKLAYRTIRSDGTAAISTSTVYLPMTPISVPAPVILIGRPTSGIADSCAPSKKPIAEPNLALPFAARGFVTITPDFAGLGNEGVHAYLDNHEAAAQLFDGGRALRALVPGNVVGAPVGAVGYSQGGGVVLSAQALEHELTGARTLRAVAALAPEWPISTRSFGYEDVLRNPGQLTSLAALSSPTVTVLRHYGFLANRMGAALAGAAFSDAERASMIASIEGLCTIPLGGALDAQQPWLRDLVEPTFRAQVLACIDGTPGCAGLGAAFHQWMVDDFVTADPAGARVLIVQGLLDQVMPAAGEAACDIAKLRAEGVVPEVCSDPLATHDTVLERRIEDVVAWIEAVATGVTAPTCGSQTMPTCSR